MKALGGTEVLVYFYTEVPGLEADSQSYMLPGHGWIVSNNKGTESAYC